MKLTMRVDGLNGTRHVPQIPDPDNETGWVDGEPETSYVVHANGDDGSISFVLDNADGYALGDELTVTVAKAAR